MMHVLAPFQNIQTNNAIAIEVYKPVSILGFSE